MISDHFGMAVATTRARRPADSAATDRARSFNPAYYAAFLLDLDSHDVEPVCPSKE